MHDGRASYGPFVSGIQVLEAHEITKRYGPVVANDALNIAVRPGEVLGLLGENGAGKSTLLSVLSGMVEPDVGELLIDGAPVQLESPHDAIRHGIGMVYQHFSLVPTFTVREQLRLAGWRSRALPALLRDHLTGDEWLNTLSLGERQRVEIAKALIAEPRFLLLDEPTSILAPTEVDDLFALLREIRQRGVAIVLVTHKLREALAIADRIVVLRHGALAATAERPAAGWTNGTESELLGAMFGDAVHRLGGVAAAPEGDEQAPLLSALGVSSRKRHDHRPVRDVTLDVREREICAIVGIDGQGQRELAEILTGYRAATGEIRICGRSLAGLSSRGFAEAGIGYLTDDRRAEGGATALSVALNLVLKRQRRRPFARGPLLNRRAVRADAARQVQAWDVTPTDIDLPLDLLSGGNIQKALLARELALAPRVLIANKPTHGLDARTQAVVWRAFRELTDRGGGVLVLTTELDEALAHADRVAVMLDGRVSPQSPVGTSSRMELARMMVTGW